MAEQLWCFEPGERLLTMADGRPTVWQVQADGSLGVVYGPPVEPGAHQHTWVGGPTDRHCSQCGVYA